MIEVIENGNGWSWRMICDQGRILAYCNQVHGRISDAANAAKAYRTAFWAMACRVDHRMAACI